MSKKFVERNTLRKALWDFRKNIKSGDATLASAVAMLVAIVDTIPGEDVEKVVHGYVKSDFKFFTSSEYCSVCGHELWLPNEEENKFNRCPYCGAVLDLYAAYDARKTPKKK